MAADACIRSRLSGTQGQSYLLSFRPQQDASLARHLAESRNLLLLQRKPLPCSNENINRRIPMTRSTTSIGGYTTRAARTAIGFQKGLLNRSGLRINP
jgi:hypothetical protein